MNQEQPPNTTSNLEPVINERQDYTTPKLERHDA